MVLDNEALYDICQNSLDLESPNFKNINQLIAQVVSALTSSFRFQGTLNSSLRDMSANLVPYPNAHFVVPAYSPFIGRDDAYREALSLSKLTDAVFMKDHQLASCDLGSGRYIACSLQYRGEVAPKEIYSSLNVIKKHRIEFVDWCSTGFKIGVSSQCPVVV